MNLLQITYGLKFNDDTVFNDYIRSELTYSLTVIIDFKYFLFLRFHSGLQQKHQECILVYRFKISGGKIQSYPICTFTDFFISSALLIRLTMK